MRSEVNDVLLHASGFTSGDRGFRGQLSFRGVAHVIRLAKTGGCEQHDGCPENRSFRIRDAPGLCHLRESQHIATDAAFRSWIRDNYADAMFRGGEPGRGRSVDRTGTPA
jgi:hypothetical protein